MTLSTIYSDILCAMKLNKIKYNIFFRAVLIILIQFLLVSNAALAFEKDTLASPTQFLVAEVVQEIKFVDTHEKTLDFLGKKQDVIIFDFHDDRTYEAHEAIKAGRPFRAKEENWVSKGEVTDQIGRWWLIHPVWQLEEVPKRFIVGSNPSLKVKDLPDLDKPVWISICFDYFLHSGTQGIDFNGTSSIIGRRLDAPEEVLLEEARALFRNLKAKGIKIKGIVAAESANYCPKDKIPLIKQILKKAWNEVSVELSQESIQVPKSRFNPFLNKHGLNFQDIALAEMAAYELKRLVISQKKREGQLYTEINALNNIFIDNNVGIEIEPTILKRMLKSTGREYQYVVFNFKRANMKLELLFFEDHENLTTSELMELKIKDSEKKHLSNSDLQGLWFRSHIDEQIALDSEKDRIKMALHQFEQSSTIKIEFNKDITKYTTLRIAAKALAFVEPSSMEDLRAILIFTDKHRIPVNIIGAGSDTFFGEEVQSLVVSMKKFKDFNVIGEEVRVGSGIWFPALANKVKGQGLSGLEFACVIPGTAGGAVVMNAGFTTDSINRKLAEQGLDSINLSTGKIVKEVKVLTLKGEIKTLSAEQIQFDTKHSIFQSEPMVIYEVTFKLKKRDKNDIASIMKIIDGGRFLSNDMWTSSLGSVFRPWDKSYVVDGQNKTAHWLIEQCEILGWTQGDIAIHQRAPTVLYNKGKGTQQEYMLLAARIYHAVYEKFGVKLIIEVKSFPAEMLNKKIVKEARIDNAIPGIFASQIEEIHKETLENAPNIPEKTILCHVIMNSVLPVGQRNMLNALRITTRDSKYSEKIVPFELDDPDNLIQELNALIVEQRKIHKGYIVKFDVACSDISYVSKILDSDLEVKSLAFEDCKEFDIVQVEGILLALRALSSGDIEKLKKTFNFLSGQKLSEQIMAISNIDEFVKRVSFILPAIKEGNYRARIILNDLIRKKIEAAA